MNVVADQESKVIWAGTPLAEIYNGLESLRYGLIDDDGVGVSEDTQRNLFKEG